MEAPERSPRAFFGRRKGHKLRPRQAQLIDERYCRAWHIDLEQARTRRSVVLVSGSGDRGQARDRIRRRRT
jgi:hypothetical protein